MNFQQTVIAILIVSLIAWTFFYMFGTPLNPPETLVVVGISGLIVLLIRSIINIFRKKNE
jgi:hypothetical protein